MGPRRTAVFWATVALPSLLIALAAGYPFIEARLSKNMRAEPRPQRPRDNPARTGLGAMALSAVGVLVISGANDTIAKVFDISLNAMTIGGRMALLLLPPIVYVIAYRICLGLQLQTRDERQHGIETGTIVTLPTGEYLEIHRPLDPAPFDAAGPAAEKISQVVEGGQLESGCVQD